jgi:hypothetical protein
MTEAGDRVVHVPRVVQRLQALLGKSEVPDAMRFFWRALKPGERLLVVGMLLYLF